MRNKYCWVVLMMSAVAIILLCVVKDNRVVENQYDPTCHLNAIDSLERLMEKTDSFYLDIIDRQTCSLKYYDSIYRAQKEQYDSLFNSMSHFTIDQHIVFLSRELSKEDSLPRQ